MSNNHENPFLDGMDTGFNIAELKRLTESSNIKADADPNKLHYDELRNISNVWTEDEARIVIKEVVKKYPGIMFEELNNRLRKLTDVMSNITSSVEGI